MFAVQCREHRHNYPISYPSFRLLTSKTREKGLDESRDKSKLLKANPLVHLMSFLFYYPKTV